MSQSKLRTSTSLYWEIRKYIFMNEIVLILHQRKIQHHLKYRWLCNCHRFRLTVYVYKHMTVLDTNLWYNNMPPHKVDMKEKNKQEKIVMFLILQQQKIISFNYEWLGTWHSFGLIVYVYKHMPVLGTKLYYNNIATKNAFS